MASIKFKNSIKFCHDLLCTDCLFYIPQICTHVEDCSTNFIKYINKKICKKCLIKKICDKPCHKIDEYINQLSEGE
jgi:hypothetical protein